VHQARHIGAEDCVSLPVVRTIVEAHGGRIDARNAANGAATFAVTLPSDNAWRNEEVERRSPETPG
jgi:K+-sensing histidine kinase KdpD